MQLLRHFGSTCLLVLACACGAALAQDRPKESIRQDTPSTGTRIKQVQVGPMRIPVNLPYEKLSEDDKAYLRSQYEDMPTGDDPPFPQSGMDAVLRPLRDAQDQMMLRGRLRAVAVIGTDGKAAQVQVSHSPAPEMTTFVARLLMLTQFRPASCNGTPCTMEFPIDLQLANF